MIVEALKTHQGNMTEAARELGLTRRILGLRMEKHGLNYKKFRKGEEGKGRMSELSAKDRYVLIVADIAMAAAIKTHDRDYVFAAYGVDYIPGSLRERWLAGTGDNALRSA